jgi:hypothetical protein
VKPAEEVHRERTRPGVQERPEHEAQ